MWSPREDGGEAAPGRARDDRRLHGGHRALEPALARRRAIAGGALLAAAGRRRGACTPSFAITTGLTVFVLEPFVAVQGLTRSGRGPDIPILDTQITTEELAYGAAAGLRIAATALAVAAFVRLADADLLLRAVARVAPRSAMIASLATQMLPALERDAAGVLVAARTRAARIARARRPPPASWGRSSGMSLERPLAVAEAMEARGYGGPVALGGAGPGALGPRARPHRPRGRRARDRRRGARHGSRRFPLLRPARRPVDGRGRRRLVGARGALGGVRMGGAMPALTFEGVSYRYSPARPAGAGGVDLAVDRAGELVLLVGESGSGKSTLLRAALGLVPHFHGGELRGPRARRRARHAQTTGRASSPGTPGSCSRIPRPRSSWATCWPRPRSGSRTWGVAPGEIGIRARAALQMVGAAHLAERTTRTLSGGEQQRVAIASVLAMGPRVLLLDEPTSQLDPAAAEELIRTLIDLRRPRRGIAIVVAEHRTEPAVRRRRPCRRDGGRARSRSTRRRRCGPGRPWPALRRCLASPAPRPSRRSGARCPAASGGEARATRASGCGIAQRRRRRDVSTAFDGSRRRDGGDRPRTAPGRRRSRSPSAGSRSRQRHRGRRTGRAGYVGQDPACYLAPRHVARGGRVRASRTWARTGEPAGARGRRASSARARSGPHPSTRATSRAASASGLRSPR